jgi:hypothetical protein
MEWCTLSPNLYISLSQAWVLTYGTYGVYFLSINIRVVLKQHDFEAEVLMPIQVSVRWIQYENITTTTHSVHLR